MCQPHLLDRSYNLGMPNRGAEWLRVFLYLRMYTVRSGRENQLEQLKGLADPAAMAGWMSDRGQRRQSTSGHAYTAGAATARPRTSLVAERPDPNIRRRAIDRHHRGAERVLDKVREHSSAA